MKQKKKKSTRKQRANEWKVISVGNRGAVRHNAILHRTMVCQPLRTLHTWMSASSLPCWILGHMLLSISVQNKVIIFGSFAWKKTFMILQLFSPQYL